MQKANFNSNIKIKSVWKKEEKSCGDHEVGMLKIFGTVIYNIKNTVNITEKEPYLVWI